MAGTPVATLSGDFEITTAGGVAELGKLRGAMDQTETRVLGAADKIERAIGQAVDATAPVAGLKQISSAIGETSATAQREFNRIERAGESLSASLDRQINAFGKTTQELRAMKVEAAALAAEQAGMAELAGRLRQQEADLYAMEFAAARQARLEEEALAQEREAAAAAAVAQKAQEAAATRNAAAAYQMFEQRVREGAAALAAEQRTQQELVTSANAMTAALEREASTFGMTATQIRAMDIAAKALALEEAGLAREAEQLRAAHQNLIAVQGRTTVQSGAQRAGFQQLSFQIGDVATQLGSGTAVMQIFAQQAGQTVQAIGLMTTEAKGFIGFIGGPWGQIITAAVVLIGTLALNHKSAAKAEDEHADAAKRVKAALDQLDQAATNDLTTERQRILNAGRMVEALVQQEIHTKQLTKAKLEDALADYQIAKAASTTGTHAGETAAFSLPQQESQIAGLRAQIAGINADLEKSATRLQNAAAFLVRDDVTRSFDKQAQAAAIYKSRVAELTQEYHNHHLTLVEYRADVAAAARALQEVKDADKNATAAAREHRHELSEQAKAAKEVAKQAKIAADIQESAIELAAKNSAAAIKAVALPDLKVRVDMNDPTIQETAKSLDLVGEFNDRLQQQAELWDAVSRNAGNAAQVMEASFGKAGAALGGLASVYAGYNAQIAREKEERDRVISSTTDQGKIERANALFAARTATTQVGMYGDMADAAKGFFAEGTKGYKALQTAEEVFRAVEFALSLKSMVQDAVETTSSVANAGVRAAADGTAAMAKTAASAPFPFNLAGMAIMAAALASIGVLTGFLGGGSSNTLPAADDGTGTILGDSTAKSDSIKRAIDTLHDVDLSTNHYSAEMAASLKSIDNQIGGLANLVVRIGGTDGLNASAGVQTGFKSNLIGNVAGSTLGGAALGLGVAAGAISTFGTFTALGAAGGPIGLAAGAIVGAVLAPVIKSLFGTKTSVVGSGIYGAPQTLGDVLAGGYDAQYYSDIQKKKKFFGLTTSTKYTTQYGDADPALEQQFGLILKSFDDAILAAAGPLGAATDDISNRLNSFVVNIGKIDTKGLTGQEIQDKLQAVFGAAADSMAQAAIPGLEKFEQVGEGYFETLVRVASTVEQVTTDLDLLGRSTAQLGIDAKMGLASQFDSISDLNSAVSTYFQDFYTDAEQSAAKAAQLGKVFDALGVQMPSTLAGFRQLVDGQDLTTAAGQQMYATLLQLAPAFASVATAGQSATDAASILRERQDLERQLAEAEGDTARVRELELAAIDPSNRAIQQLIYARQDEAAAAQVAAQQAEQRASLQQQIWQLQGNTDAIRAAQLDAITDPVAKAMQQQIFSLQDQQAAAQAAQQAADEAAQKADQLRQAWESTGDSIEDEIKRIRGLSDTDGAVSFAKQQADFDAAVQLAMGGNQDAAKSLPGLSKTLLDTASAVASSRQELDRIQATTAAALQTVADKIGSITTAALGPTAAANDNFDQNWWAEFASKVATTPAATSNSRSMADLRDALDRLAAEQEQTKAELVNALAQIAATNQKMADILSRAEKLGQGDGLAVATSTERAAA